MGAVVAATLADLEPDRIGRLILEDPAWYPRDDVTPAETAEFVRLPDAGYNVRRDQFEATLNLVRDFLRIKNT